MSAFGGKADITRLAQERALSLRPSVKGCKITVTGAQARLLLGASSDKGGTVNPLI